MATAHLLSTLLPVTSIALGRLVTNANQPHENFLDPLPFPLSSTTHYPKFTETRKLTKGLKVPPALGSLINFIANSPTTGTVTLLAENTTTYDLMGPDAWFEASCAQEGTRRWLGETIDNHRTVYLIVGFRTVRDNPKETEPLLGSPGESVFAVLYRKVTLRYLRDEDVARLLEEGNARATVCECRGPAGNGDGEDRILEAACEEGGELDLLEAEEEELDDRWCGFPRMGWKNYKAVVRAAMWSHLKGQIFCTVCVWVYLWIRG